MTEVIEILSEDKVSKFPQLERVERLGHEAGMVVTLQGSRTREPDDFYESTSKEHNKGDIKRKGGEVTHAGALLLAPDRSFALQIFWTDQKMLLAKWGGPHVGYRIKWGRKITEVYETLKALKGVWMS